MARAPCAPSFLLIVHFPLFRDIASLMSTCIQDTSSWAVVTVEGASQSNDKKGHIARHLRLETDRDGPFFARTKENGCYPDESDIDEETDEETHPPTQSTRRRPKDSQMSGHPHLQRKNDL
ncbi:hypothetical protein VFPPC_11187 [Pochonia chlamydosporia 170]|uniref:Uncharacterized protein n=1 Tax=Pochonia chlamydosporia 170 TaxID=1380566 RepID=A0A179FBS9_METCM|nr:hypothetical protein VFPPC_11187 [Pochonia chlamydosporia 170]OAQ62760.1 hypothetical protein VFPPC_11187 [Pochonia chlamydosporia 170]